MSNASPDPRSARRWSSFLPRLRTILTIFLASPVIAALIAILPSCQPVRLAASTSPNDAAPSATQPVSPETTRAASPPSLGRLPDVDARDRFEIMVITCSAPNTHDAIIKVLRALQFDNISDRSQVIYATADRFRDPTGFSRSDSVIYARKQDKDVAVGIAERLTQSPTIKAVAPRDYSAALGDTPSDQRKIYIHTGGGECPRTRTAT